MEQEFWIRASVHVGKTAKANFEDLTEEEYAATCLLWALRWFKVKEMPARERTRLLTWIAFLLRKLKKA